MTDHLLTHHARRMACAGLLLVLAISTPGPVGAEQGSQGKIVLADGGVTDYVIAVGDQAPAPDRHAAEELQTHLKQISGADFPIVSPTDAQDRPRIAVGPEAALAVGLDNKSLDGLGSDGILMKTRPPHLVLTGQPDAPRGTLYAVYTFLEETLGCRWWTDKASHVPKMNKVEIPKLATRFVPVLEYREPFYYHVFDGDWAVRNKSNGHSERLDAVRGGKWVYRGFVHTFFPLVPPQEHFASDPQWYSELDGKRTWKRAQLCLTNQELLSFVIEQVKSRLRGADPFSIISVSQNDWHGACRCENCRRIDEAEGSHAGTLLHFVNGVAAGIEDEFPHAAVDTLAYQYTRKPPKKVRPRHNVIVRLCSIECNFGEPLNHETNHRFREDLEGWSKIADRLYVWDYVTNFSNYTQPHPNWFVLGENVRFFTDHNVKGIFEQGTYNTAGGEMAELRAWVLAKLLWDPTRDEQQLVDEFLTGYFGDAAPHIAAYMRRMHGSLAQSGFYLRCFTRSDAPFLTPEVLFDSVEYFKNAEKAVADEAETLQRVQLAKLPVLYVALQRWDHLRTHATAIGREWPLSDSRSDVLNEVKRIFQANGMRQFAEHGDRNLDWLRRIAAD